MENILKEHKKRIQKIRLDDFLIQTNTQLTKSKAQALILSGSVFVNEKKITKAGCAVKSDDKIYIKRPIPYVSFGGVKLFHALTTFKIDVTNFICMDVGVSTGGFTDCLLQNGAIFVYAIDVGYGQLDPKLRNDSRVHVFEKTNIRNFEQNLITHPCDLIVIDVSFISLRLVIPAVIPFLKDNAHIIMLFKPQFEVGKNNVGKGGIVRDKNILLSCLEEFMTFLKQFFFIKGWTESPRQNTRKNEEVLIYVQTKCT